MRLVQSNEVNLKSRTRCVELHDELSMLRLKLLASHFEHSDRLEALEAGNRENLSRLGYSEMKEKTP
jgi:hypothetical protein